MAWKGIQLSAPAAHSPAAAAHSSAAAAHSPTLQLQQDPQVLKTADLQVT